MLVKKALGYTERDVTTVCYFGLCSGGIGLLECLWDAGIILCSSLMANMTGSGT